jgi:DNA-binding GntR family transcriptional regulator
VGVVAATATDLQIAELEALHQALENAAKPEHLNKEAFFEINERFHLRLLEIANNRWRDQMVTDLRKVMKLNRHNSLLKSGRIEESLNEHRAVMSAVAARNPALSMQKMQEHFKNGLEAAN